MGRVRLTGIKPWLVGSGPLSLCFLICIPGQHFPACYFVKEHTGSECIYRAHWGDGGPLLTRGDQALGHNFSSHFPTAPRAEWIKMVAHLWPIHSITAVACHHSVGKHCPDDHSIQIGLEIFVPATLCVGPHAGNVQMCMTSSFWKLTIFFPHKFFFIEL